MISHIRSPLGFPCFYNLLSEWLHCFQGFGVGDIEGPVLSELKELRHEELAVVVVGSALADVWDRLVHSIFWATVLGGVETLRKLCGALEPVELPCLRPRSIDFGPSCGFRLLIDDKI